MTISGRLLLLEVGDDTTFGKVTQLVKRYDTVTVDHTEQAEELLVVFFPPPPEDSKMKELGHRELP